MFVEFLMQQWMLVGALAAVALVLFYYEASKGGKSVSPQQLSQLVNKQDGVVLDIRDSSDFRKGHITDSHHIPFKDLAQRYSELNAYKEKPIIIICKMGQTAGSASKQLKALGFTEVYKLGGGLSEWTSNNLPLVK